MRLKKIKTLRIKEVLKQKGITQIELSQKLKMREDSLSLSLKNETLNVSKLQKIAYILDVPITELFEIPKTDCFTCPNCGAKLAVTEKGEH